MSAAYKELLRSYMDESYVARTNLSQIVPSDEDHFKPLTQLYQGVAVMQELTKEGLRGQDENVLQFKKNLLCSGIKKRFVFVDPLLQGLAVFEPSVACSPNRAYNSTIYPFTDLVPRAKPADLQRLDDEWRKLIIEELPEDIRREKEVDVFWHKLSQLKDSEGDQRFIALPAYVLTVLSLPHSNADVERVFSKVTNTRSKLRNRLKTKNVEGCCLASELVRGNENCCAGFMPTSDMVQRMASKRLYDDEDGEEESISSLNLIARL